MILNNSHYHPPYVHLHYHYTNTTVITITILLIVIIFPHVRLEVHHLSKAGVGVPSPVVPGPDVPAITFNASFHHPLLHTFYILY